MIVCSNCGHANGAQDAFCGSCGGFLEWDGESVAPPAAASRPRTAGGRPPQQAGVPAEAAADLLTYERADTNPPTARGSVLVTEEPATGEVAARQPEAEHERPAPLRPDPVDLGPADLYCGACGAGNAAGRSFCRRCGAPLEDAEPAERLRWWQRLWRWIVQRRWLPARLGGRRHHYTAGERPRDWATGTTTGAAVKKRRRWWRPRMPTRLSLGRAALPLALLSLVGFGIAPIRAVVTEKAFGLYYDVRRVVAPRYVPVSASSATATSAVDGHDAAAAIDQNTLTWWAEGAPGRGRLSRLQVRFDRPVDLDRITVHNGAADAAYPFQPRVRGLRVTLRGKDGVLAERRVVLADKRALQQVEVSAGGVTRVSFRLLSTYAGQRGSAASLAEVGFLSKR